MHPSDPIRRLLNADFGRFTQGIDIMSLWRWVRLSVAVGLLTGGLAALFFYLLEFAERGLFFRLAGHDQPVLRSALFDYGQGDRVWWLILLLPAAGGLVAGLVLHFLAPPSRNAHKERQGTEAMIHAFHQRGGKIRLRDAMSRALATAFTLGTGGSAGREGPIAYAGASFGSYFAQRFKLSDRDRRLLLLAGAAGGISALFRTPLGAALFVLEVLYVEDFEAEGMFPVVVSSVTAYSLFTAIYGQGSLFHVPEGGYHFAPSQLFLYGLMAIIVAPLGVLWVKLHTRAAPSLFQGLGLPRWLKPALGGLLLGALALALPWVIGTGYGWIQDALLPVDDPSRRLPVGYRGFWILLALAGAKMVATQLTLASGGSGGSFAPTLFIGGFLGGAFGLLFHELFPGTIDQPGAFVLVGMGAFYAGAAKSPLSTMIMISELFGSYDLLVPLMLAIMISILLLRHVSIFPSMVGTQMDSPAHAARFTVDVLEDLRVEEHYTKGRAAEPIQVSMPLGAFLSHVQATAESFFVVANKEGKLVGTVSLDHVRSVVSEHEFLDFIIVGDAMTPFFSVSPTAPLGNALKKMVEQNHEFAPVMDPSQPDTVLGIISQRQISAEYNAEILRRRIGDEERETLAD